MKKLLATLTTVAMLATSTVAFADVVANDEGYNKTAGTYSVAANLSAVEGQLTLLIIPEAAYLADAIEDEDILYIDQGAYANGLFQSVGILGGTTLEAGTYYAKIGGKGLNDIIVESFTIVDEGGSEGGEGTNYTVGDVDGDNDISVNDVTTIVDKLLGNITYFTKGEEVLPYFIGDADDDADISVNDVTTIVDKLLGNIENFKKATYTLPAGTTAVSTYPVN